MNICLITTEYPPGPMGGIGTYCTILTEELVRRGHAVTVVTKHVAGAPRRAKHGNLTVYRLDTRNFLNGKPVDLSPDQFATEMTYLRHYCGIFSREVWKNLPLLHKKHRFDVILSQDIEAPMWITQENVLLFNKLVDVPVVVFVHSPHRDCNLYNDETLYEHHEYHRAMYETHTMALADHLLFASEYMRQGLLRNLRCDEDKTSVIPYPIGAPPAPYPFDERVGSGASDEKLIVYAGRIELRKGIENLIRAFVPLAQQDPDLCLHLCGRECEHPTLHGSVAEILTRKHVPEAVSDRIRCIGHMERDELWDEYGRATLGVVPSLWEPFGYVCQEMMATGLPVVATREGGMAEMIEHDSSGFLCESNPRAIEDALRYALALPEDYRRKVGEAAAARIHAHCDNDTVIGQTLDLFTRLGDECRARLGAPRRLCIPANLPFADRPLSHPHPRRSDTSPPLIANVAVVIPCYNMGEDLDPCVASLVGQDRPPDRIVIVNDGSTEDATLRALDNFRDMAGVSVLDFENSGLPTARNRGAQEALCQGADGLVFLDADDELDPTYLRKATEVLNRHPEAGAVTAWTHSVGMMNTWWIPFHGQFPYLLAECMSTPPAMVRASVFQDIGGFSPELRYSYEDWDFWVSVCERGFAMLVIPEPLIIYRMREGSMSREYKAATREHGRRAMVRRHSRVFAQYGGEALLLAEGFLYAARGDSTGAADLTQEIKKCQDFIAYLGSLPGRPLEAIRFVASKLGERIRLRLHPAGASGGQG
jgi:glycogen synthase